jgi:hypothetical protein
MILPLLTLLQDKERMANLKVSASYLMMTMAEKGKIAADKILSALTGKTIIQKTAEAGARAGTTATVEAETVANEELAVAEAASMWYVMVFIAIAAVLIAALYGVYRIIKSLVEAESE